MKISVKSIFDIVSVHKNHVIMVTFCANGRLAIEKKVGDLWMSSYCRGEMGAWG
jgi:hypothetical protein